MVALYGICQHFGLDYYVWEQKSPRFESISTIGNSNLLGLFLILACPLPLVYGMASNSWRRRIYYFLSEIVILLCLYMTYSRGSIVSLIISLPVWTLILLKGKNKLTKKHLLIFLITIIIIFLLVGIFYKGISSFTGKGTNSAQVRIFLWKAAIKILIVHPAGIGFNTYSFYYLPYRYNEPLVNRNRLAYAENSHNEFLDIAVATGIVGILSFLCFLGIIITGGFKILPDLSGEDKIIMTGSFLSITSYIINLNTVFSEISSLIFFWFLLGLILAIQIKGKVQVKIYPIKTKTGVKWLLILFLSSLFLFHLWQNINTLLASHHIYLAKEAKGKNNLKESIYHISEALKRKPQNSDYWLTMAKTLESAISETSQNKEILLNTIFTYRTSIKVNPLDPYPHADLGRLYSIYSNILGPEYLNKSIEEYERSLAIDPYNIFFLNDLATTYNRQGKYHQAIQYYEKSLQIYEGPNTYNMLGRTLMDMGKIEEAEMNLKRAIKLDPSSGDAYFNLAYIYIQKNKTSLAFDMIDKAFYLKPTDKEIGRLWRQLAKEVRRKR